MPSVYTTTQGDTWDSIAKSLWGEERLFHHLVAANPDHRETVIFSAGAVLSVPEIESPATIAVTPPWKA